MSLKEKWKLGLEILKLPATIVGAVVACAVILAFVPKVFEWVHTHPAPIETFLFVELAGLGTAVILYGIADALRYRRLVNDRKRKLRAWDDLGGPVFRYRAHEMPVDAPAIHFLLPARAIFDPQNPWPITALCGLCGDRPPLVSGTTPGFGNGLCCAICKTVYSERQLGEVQGDALRAINRRLNLEVEVSST